MMKSVRLAAIVLSCLCGASLTAAPIAEETFEGLTPGDLDTQGSGSGWSGNWSAGPAGEQVVNTTLSYTFTGGQVVDGGSSALQIDGGTNSSDLLGRDFSAAVTDHEVYFSFLYQRTAGTGGSGSLDDFVMWWFDDASPSAPHSDGPNIGVFDESDAGNHLVARNGINQGGWVQGGGSSNTTDTYFVVGRMAKGADGTNANDYDAWDLWLFNDAASPRSILDLSSPDASNSQPSNRTQLNTLGMRTVGTSAGDTFVFDELRVGTSMVDVVPFDLVETSTAAAINGAHTLTFSELGDDDKYTVTGSDGIFAQHGIADVSADATNGSDKANQGGHDGHGLFADASDLYILQENENTTTFGETTGFTLDFTRKHRAFGLSLQDDVASTFTLTFFNDGVEQGSTTHTTPSDVSNTPVAVQTAFEFDRVVIAGGAGGDGWGIDNVVLDAVHEVGLDNFDDYAVIDFESFSAGPTGSNVFTTGEISVTATGGSSGGDVQSVGSDDDNGLFYDGSEFLILPAGENTTPFGSNQQFTIDFDHVKNLVGMVLADQGEGDFTFTFYLQGELQAEYLKNLPNTNNQTFYFATDFLFDRVVVDAVGNDGFGLDNITYNLIPEPSSLALLVPSALLTLRRRTQQPRI